MVVEQYLSLHGCAAAGRSKLYDAGFVAFVRAAHSDDNKCVFVRGQVLAEMRKGVTYVVDIKLSQADGILETQCECPAGVGPSAHCKHVHAILIAFQDFTMHRRLNLNLTCTQKLQSFHKAKKFLSSPMKTQNLQFVKPAEESQGGTPKSLRYDPRPSWARNSGGYEAYMRNTTINYQSHYNSSVPLAQLYTAANTRALEHDHDYCSSTLSDIFLSEIGVSAISDQQAQVIERETNGQANNPKWISERRVRLHASQFKRICRAQDKSKVAKDLTTYRKVTAAALKHGRKFEIKAIHEFVAITGITVQSSGIIVNRERPYLACSPDGITSCNSLVEVKCPFVAKDKVINPETIDYIYLDEQTGLMALDCSHEYYYQIQGQMYVTDCTLCYFVIYTFLDFLVIKVPRDDIFVANMLVLLDDFFHDHFKAAVLQKFFYCGQ